MREILFRGKRIDNGEWVQGYLKFHYVDGRDANGFTYIGMSSIYDQENALSHDVLTSTIGQYTGLCDKNGKKIFEGDVVVGTFYHMFDEPNSTFTIRWQYDVGGWAFNNYDTKSLEIIGNATDNPELVTP